MGALDGPDCQKRVLIDVLKFVGPALVIPLADPAMTLIDTLCIGQFAGTMELAAMGPALMIFSFTQYLFQSLQVVTVSFLATSISKQDYKEASKILSTSLTLALLAGLSTATVLEVAAPALVAATGVDPALVGCASDYVRLRAVAQPAVQLAIVSQAALMAQRDSSTPCAVTAVSATLSALGNAVFVAGLGWGLTGAAITTAAVQYMAAGALLWALATRGQIPLQLRPLHWADVATVLSAMAPLALTHLCKNLCYLSIQTTAATLGTIKLAAHQAVFATWNIAAYASFPVEQAALTFMSAASSSASSAATSARTTTVRVLLLLGTLFGAVAGLFAGGVPLLLPALFTPDTVLWPSIAAVAPQAALSQLLIGMDVTAVALLIAARDVPYVMRSFVLTFACLLGFMAVCRLQDWGLPGVWWGVVFFFGLRALQSCGRLAVTRPWRTPAGPADATGAISGPHPAPA